MKRINIFIILLLSVLFLSGCSGLVKTQNYSSVIAEWYLNSDNKNSKILRGSAKDYITANSDNYILKFIDHEGNLIPAKDLKYIKSSPKWWGSRTSKEEYEESLKLPYYSRENQLARAKGRLDHCIFKDDEAPFTSEDMHKATADRFGIFSMFKRIEINEYFREVAKQRGVEGEVAYCIWGTRAEATKKYLEIKNNQNWTYPSDWEDDDTKFYYYKNERGEYIKGSHLDHLGMHPRNFYVAVKECYDDGFCKLYPRDDGFSFYVKKAGLLDMSEMKNVLNNYIEKENIKNQK